MQFLSSNPLYSDIVNSVKNPLLISSIRAMRYGANDRNRENFLRTFTRSTLVCLTTSAPITPDHSIPETDEEGFNLYGVDTRISLVQITTEDNSLYLPVFTDCSAVRKVPGLCDYHGLALNAKTILEMAITAESAGIILNPGTDEHTILDRELIGELVSDLRSKDLLPEEKSLNLISHSFQS